MTNAGPGAASGIALSGLSGCALPVTTLASGANMSCTATVTANTVGNLVQVVSVTSNETDPNPGNNTASVTVTVNPAADLSLTLTDSPDPVLLGQTITYTTTVKNNGPSATSGVTASGSLPTCFIVGYMYMVTLCKIKHYNVKNKGPIND